MTREVRLQVNIDHVATLRQARRAAYPDPVAAARVAEDAGASGITVHLRSDRRHIQEHDVERLRETVRGRLNLEMAATEEMITIALRVRPDQVSLVPERPEELTTEGGIDLLRREVEITRAASRLAAAGIDVSLFLDPDLVQIERLPALSPHVTGFEINTDAYTRASETERSPELAKVAAAARRGRELGFRVFAGHGLTSTNVAAIAAIPEIEELNIGHWLVCRAVELGMAGAVCEMLAALHPYTLR